MELLYCTVLYGNTWLISNTNFFLYDFILFCYIIIIFHTLTQPILPIYTTANNNRPTSPPAAAILSQQIARPPNVSLPAVASMLKANRPPARQYSSIDRRCKYRIVNDILQEASVLLDISVSTISSYYDIYNISDSLFVLIPHWPSSIEKSYDTVKRLRSTIYDSISNSVNVGVSDSVSDTISDLRYGQVSPIRSSLYDTVKRLR